MTGEIETRAGWVVVACAHVVFALWAGLLKTIGVLLPALTEYFQTDTLVLGWVSALVCATNNIAAVFGSLLSVFIGGRQVVVLGGVMATSGLLLAAISSNVLQFALCLIVLTGLGFGAVMCICKVYLGFYFNERLALASGIATMGVPVGIVIFPALAEFLLQTYDVQGTLLIFGALTMHLVVCGILFGRDTSSGRFSGGNGRGSYTYEPLPASRPRKEGDERHLSSILTDRLKTLLDVRALTSLDMWMLIVIYTLFSFVNDSWMVFTVHNAQSKGFGNYVATVFSIIAGCSAVVFSILQGVVISRGTAGVRVTAALATAVGCTALFINPLLDDYFTMGVAVAMYGVTLAVLNPSIVCLVIETQGREGAASAFGWTGLSSGLFRILFGFSTGLLYDVTGAYDLTFILLGFMTALIVPMLFLDRLVSGCRNVVDHCKCRTDARPT